MAIEILGTGQPDGTSIVKAVTEKVCLYGGTGVVQADTIADTTHAGTDTAGLCTDVENLTVAVNAIIAVLDGLEATATE